MTGVSGGKSAPGTPQTLRRGQSLSALPLEADVNLFGDSEDVIHLDTQVADSALDLAMAKEELNGRRFPGSR